MRIYAFLIMSLFTGVTNASTSIGMVSKVTISYKAGKFYFQLDPVTQDYAACATSKRYVIDATTEQGKMTASGILTAKAAQQTVTVFGDNQCTIQPDSEDVWFITIE